MNLLRWAPVVPVSYLFMCYRGEHLLLFLVQTVARQTVEHCQYRPPRIREDRNRKTANPEGETLSQSQDFLSHKTSFTMSISLQQLIFAHPSSFLHFQIQICLIMIWNLHGLHSLPWNACCKTGMPWNLWSCLARRRIKTRVYSLTCFNYASENDFIVDLTAYVKKNSSLFPFAFFQVLVQAVGLDIFCLKNKSISISKAVLFGWTVLRTALLWNVQQTFW